MTRHEKQPDPGFDGPSSRNSANYGVSRSIEIAFPLLIILATLIPYWQTASFGFVNFDDQSYVYQNPLLTEGLSSDRVKDAVFGVHQGNWHPLVWLSYMAEDAIFGMKPQVMHITNVLLHIANRLLLYFRLRRVTEDPVRSFLAALIFAIHPLHVESVAWITERYDVLSSLFLLATLIAYSEYVRKHSRWWYLAAVILFALGLTAKGMLVTLPIVFALLDFWPLKRFQIDSVVKFDRTTLRGILVDKIPFVVLSVMIASITIMAQRSGGTVAGITSISLDGRLANSVVSVSRYLFKAVWPMHLSVFYPMRRGGWGAADRGGLPYNFRFDHSHQLDLSKATTASSDRLGLVHNHTPARDWNHSGGKSVEGRSVHVRSNDRTFNDASLGIAGQVLQTSSDNSCCRLCTNCRTSISHYTASHYTASHYVARQHHVV